MNAAGIAAALGERAEEVCRRYLPRGRKQGRYWVAGDLEGAKGRSLFVRLSGPGVPGKWTDAATSQHGDLLDIIRHHSAAPTLRAAFNEARTFLALPTSPSSGEAGAYDASEAARRLWRRCRAIGGTHAEAYLHTRGLTHCSFPALRFHPELFYRDGAGMRRLPALVAAITGSDGVLTGVQRTWLDPRTPAKAEVAHPRKALGRIHGLAVRFGRYPHRQRRYAPCRRGHRDRVVPDNRRSIHYRRGRSFRRKSRRLRAAFRRLRASSLPGITTARVNAPPNASRGDACRLALKPP